MKHLRYMTAAMLLMLTLPASAETLKGYVYTVDRIPLADVVVTSSGAKSVRTDNQGFFSMEVEPDAYINVWADGCYSQTLPVRGRSEIKIIMIDLNTYKYSENGLEPCMMKKDFAPGATMLDQAMQGEIDGLLVTRKSGMPGEGAAMQLHGLRTLTAESMPLIVINGMPYMPSIDESQLIDGYSKSLFQAYHLQDIASVRLLTGTEAARYGSLASNGVLLIETDAAASDNMETRITYNGGFGYNWNNHSIPLMNASQYKSYLSDIGMTRYDNMETFFNDFSFLSPDESDAYNYLYDFDTDWQNQLYRRGMTTDHLIRVEGGDAVAKYDMSVGYAHDEGTLINTSSDRFNAQINSDVIVSKKFEIVTSLGLAYLDGSYQVQGMSVETNPILAALRRAPVLSPYKSDMYGNLLDSYSSYNYGINTSADLRVSNPVSIVNTLSSSKRQYDANLQASLSYRPTRDLSVNAQIGLFYNYDQEGVVIPGINNSDIVPLFDSYGRSDNMVRQGVSRQFNLFYAVNGVWNHSFGQHQLSVNAGTQFLRTDFETDMGVGRNTPSDFYQTLSDVQKVGRFFDGYGSKWNWANIYTGASYTWNDLFNLGVTVATDGASSTGDNAPRFGVFPAISANVLMHHMKTFAALNWLDRLTLHADFGKTGNSRFSGTYSQYYYVSQPYQGIAGIIRQNVPNTSLRWEDVLKANLGFDASLLGNRMALTVGYYNDQASNVLMAGTSSSLYGTGIHYSNGAAISASGIDASVRIAPIYGRNFKWIVGGKVTTLHNEVTTLGEDNSLISTLSDGATLITKVGENPYSFYGLQADGEYPVFSTTLEARTAYTDPLTGVQRPMRNRNGINFEAGDVKYIDQNNDGVINDADRVVLGSATPDMYGSFFNRFQYKGFAIDANFVWSVGNEAYNAVRRIAESSLDFSNQSLAVMRRWTMDGQVTDMPRAQYNNLVGNNDFSSRWIEDASYLKLRDITLSYSFDKMVLNLFQGGTVYLSGQNLWCVTDYLGGDPEFAYSYDAMMQGVDYAKVTLPKSVRFGVNLKF